MQRAREGAKIFLLGLAGVFIWASGYVVGELANTENLWGLFLMPMIFVMAALVIGLVQLVIEVLDG